MPRERILPPQKNLVSPGKNEEESLLKTTPASNTAERRRNPPAACLCTTARRRHLLPHSRLTHCLKKKTPPLRPESNLPEPATAPLTRDAPKIDREESKLRGRPSWILRGLRAPCSSNTATTGQARGGGGRGRSQQPSRRQGRRQSPHQPLHDAPDIGSGGRRGSSLWMLQCLWRR